MADCSWFLAAEEDLAEKLAALAQFQEFCGVAGAVDPVAAAASHIFHEIVERDDKTKLVIPPAELAAKRPYAILGTESPEVINAADGGGLAMSGDVTVILEINHAQIELADPTALSIQSKNRWMKDQFGKLIVDICEVWPIFRRVYQVSYGIDDPIQGKPAPLSWAQFNILYGPEA